MSQQNKNDPDDGERDTRVQSSITPRHSMRATPLAPRPSHLADQEYEGMVRIAELKRAAPAPPGLESRSSVLGYVTADASGTVSSIGDACSGPFPDRVHYFAELARLVGIELGFETLSELHATSDKQRIVWTARPDGGWAAALSTPAERPADLARALRGER